MDGQQQPVAAPHMQLRWQMLCVCAARCAATGATKRWPSTPDATATGKPAQPASGAHLLDLELAGLPHQLLHRRHADRLSEPLASACGVGRRGKVWRRQRETAATGEAAVPPPPLRQAPGSPPQLRSAATSVLWRRQLMPGLGEGGVQGTGRGARAQDLVRQPLAGFAEAQSGRCNVDCSRRWRLRTVCRVSGDADKPTDKPSCSGRCELLCTRAAARSCSGQGIPAPPAPSPAATAPAWEA